jgi:diadenylate cyclase
LEDALRPFVNIRDLSTGQIIVNVVDILLVAYLIYRLLLLVRGARAWRIILGVALFLVVLVLSGQLGLNSLHWLLERATFLGPLALVILFLPELRQALEGFGALPQRLVTAAVTEERAEARTIEELVAACTELAAESIGALIVVEKANRLDEIIGNGVALGAKVSAPLLGSIFYGENPLHDGAVLVRGDTIMAAACRLPLSESQRLDPMLHMRHRAAVGVSEQYDCLAIVVSEERGSISVAVDGRFQRLASALELRELLNRELRAMVDDRDVAKRKRLRLKRNEQPAPEGPEGGEEQ